MEQQRMSLQLILHSYACSVIRNKYLQFPLEKNSQQAFLTFTLKHINTERSNKGLANSVAKTQKKNKLIDMLDKVVEEILVDGSLIIIKT